MQMIGLYKDPTGKNSVFSEAGPSVDTDVKCLQERVVQLEKQLTEVRLAGYFCTVSIRFDCIYVLVRECLP